MTVDSTVSDGRLRGLSDTMRAFAEATIDYQRLLATVAERMARLVGHGCIVALVSEDLQRLIPAAVFFEDPILMQGVQGVLSNGPVPIGSSKLSKRLVEQRQCVLIPYCDQEALSAELSPQNAEAMRHVGVRSLLAVPLEMRGGLLGVVALLRVGRDAQAFDADDEAIARNLGEHAALAISNAQLLESRQREIEERKRAEEQATRFEALIQHSGEFIAMASLDSRVLFINQAGRKLLGIEPDADVTQLQLPTFHTPDGLKRADVIREHGRYQGPGQLRHLRTGELIDTQVSSFLVRDEQGRPFAFATVQHDMREMKNLEAHVRQTQRLEALGRLAGGIAHDFNNILSVILSYSTILLSELEPGTSASEDVQEIHAAGERAARLTRQLLAFSRRQLLEPRIVDLNEVVSGMEKMTRRLLGEDIVLKVALCPTLGRVRIDVSQIEQVLLNLALNARDAMQTGGVLTIATDNVVAPVKIGSDEAVPAVTLSVRDTGSGMDEATRQRAFEPFFTTKGKGKGTGLGLATVFGVVEQSGGRLTLTSEVGQGTTFVIYLPRCDEPVAAPRSSFRPKQPLARGNATVLLVEDEAQVRKLLRAVLVAAGYRVLDAAGPLEALRHCEQFSEEIHLLVTDVVMPTMSGRELAELLKRTRQQTKVLYLSGYTEEAIAQHGVLDADHVLLQKPVTPDLLLERIREILDPTLPSRPGGPS
ncbi:MAG TPA: ATP-binding protein [Polyangiaceae bacterium]|nr:ATP-binding protein [Polyangiaceae bacterium]